MGLFDTLKRKKRKRAVVVGLDGVPYTMLEDLKIKGRIPNMESIFNKGYFGQMSVCIPEISSVSWSSFMTGAQPGEHGIYGFVDLEPGTYKMYFPNFTHLQAPTLWDDLADQNKKTVIINMPATYPARPINGALISGFVAIDISKAVYPSTLIPLLTKMNYRIDMDTARAREDHEFLFNELDVTLTGRQAAVDFLWGEVDWDLFVVVVTGTDRLMHFLWEAYEDEAHPHHRDFLEYFSKVDSFVGVMYERFSELNGSQDGNNQFYMLSDHGFTEIKTEVYLNRWMQENGYLKFGKESPETIMDIGPGSAAFTLDPSRIHINLRGKYPLGTVDLKDYGHVREELKQGLESLTFKNSQKIVKKVYTKEELYHGACLDRAPDLVVLANEGYDLKGKVNSATVFGRTNLTGMHRMDDAFYFNTCGAHCTSIFDVKEIILKRLLEKED